ncbi:MAG: hypothetical protein V1664_00555 [Candidatus Uhrbacteria bacterium]
MIRVGKKKITFFFSAIVFVLSAPVALAATSNSANKTVSSTAAKSSSSDFLNIGKWLDDFNSTPFLAPENLLRLVRVLALVFAILFINILLVGSFRSMINGLDDSVAKSRREIVIGLSGTLVVFFIYFWASAMLVKLQTVT